MKRTLSAALSLLLAASASAQVPVSTLARIGTAAAVAGAVKAVSAGSPVGHVIASGKPLFLNDHVTTDAAGRLQVLLLDETVFTLGPSSDMVLDEFVYDPKSASGKVSATISNGSFRFVTGKIAQKDPSKLKIKLAVGTIGVRGSIGVGETGPGGTTIINGGARNPDNHDDSAGIYAQSGGHVENLSQPGVGTHISPDGKIAPASFMGGELNRIMGGLQTQPGKSGGKGGEPAGGGKRTATDASGRSTSVGGAFAADSSETLGLADAASTNLTLATQQFGGISTWDQVRSITTGIGTYAGNGTWTCISGGCTVGSTGAWDFNIPVNFATRQITGGSIFFNAAPGLPSDTGTLTSNSYATLTGQANLALINGSTINSGVGGNFNGTSLAFTNAGGVAAGGMNVKLNYQGTIGTPVISGTATGTR